MTDVARFKEILVLFDIGYREHETEEEIIFELETGMKNVDGYAGFTTTFTFNKGEKWDMNETFKSLSIME